jgi:hypothetical protein
VTLDLTDNTKTLPKKRWAKAFENTIFMPDYQVDKNRQLGIYG